MAIYFVRARVIARSGGQSAVAAAAYRSGLKITDEQTGIIHDYTKKQGIEHSEILSPIAATKAKAWLADRSKLWNKVEEIEKRHDAQLSREMIIAIPRELERENQIALVRQHVQSSYVDRGMIADINLHHLDSDNPHAHVMLTMRELKIDDRGTVSFGNKDRTWNKKKLIETQKKEWEILTNQYLERAGIETRIDSRSYEEQEIARIPQVHVGAAAWRLEQQGIRTTPGDRNREVAIANQEIANNQTNMNQANQTLAEFAAESERRDAEDIVKYSAAKEKFLREKEATKAPKRERINLSMKKKIEPQLIRSIMATADRLGTDYHAGNYQVQIMDDEIKVSYQNNSVMIIYADACNALPLDRSYTVDQYGQGLMRSIDLLLINQQQPLQLDQSEEETPQGDPAPELSQGIINDDAPINRQQSEIEKLDPKSQSPSPKTRRLDYGR